ncbi:hypothetical protein ACIQ9E_12750 [Streptomyces sp. NPDC094448]|uniref:hypothetical protein n=1 Tax=Streptomyces sp. NPDC094448 TaxID=3366063 RepID=UPI0037FEA04A
MRERVGVEPAEEAGAALDRALHGLGRTAEAAEDLARAVELDPSVPADPVPAAVPEAHSPSQGLTDASGGSGT